MNEHPSPLRTNGELPSSFVRIVYHQLSLMGFSDPFAQQQEKTEEKQEAWMVCTRRLFQLPVFVSVSSTFTDAYRAVTLNPLAEQVVAALETPLKTADNAVCVSLDFLEEHVPSIKLQPSQIYTNVVNSFRSVFESTVATLFSIKDQLTQLMANVQEKPKGSIQA